MAVVAFRLDSHCDGISKHMECQSNRHKLHPLSENDGQPLYAFVYPSCALSDISLARLGAGFGSALADIFQTESLRILAERISQWEIDTRH